MSRKVVAAALMSALFLAGCETQESLTKKRIKKVEKGLLRAVTIKGQNPEKLALSARIPFYKVPGVSLAVMDRHEIEWAKAYGVRDAQTLEPATTETLFQAGALGQPLVSVATLVLAAQGRPGLPEGKAPDAALLAELVLGPVGMTRSTFRDASSEGPPASAASGHGRDGRPVRIGTPGDPAAAAAEFWTNPSELLAFMADLMSSAMDKGGRVLDPERARSMLMPQAGVRSDGFAVEGSGQDVRFHGRGRAQGFACALDIYPYRGQGAIILTNSDNGFLLADEILRALSEVYEWPDFKPVEKTLYRLDPSIYPGYVGRYEVTPEYALDVSHEDYYLVIRPTGQAPTRFFVESQTFFFSVDPYIRIQFHTDEKGDVTGLTLWQQDFKQEARKVG